MPLLRLNNVSIAFGTHALLDNAAFQLDAGERVGLLGRNGEGKSTLMKIIAGDIHADHGDIWQQPELRLAWLEQSPNLEGDDSIYDAVAGGLGNLGKLIVQYHELLAHMDGSDACLQKLGEVQHELEALNGWVADQSGEFVLSWDGWRVETSLPVFALALGVIDTLGKYFFSQAASYLLYAAVFALLLWRPQGLLPAKSAV